MIDLAWRVSGLRRLKWLCTLTASVALMIAGGVTINWVSGFDTYRWSTVPVALIVAGIAVAVRHAIALKQTTSESIAEPRSSGG